MFGSRSVVLTSTAVRSAKVVFESGAMVADRSVQYSPSPQGSSFIADLLLIWTTQYSKRMWTVAYRGGFRLNVDQQ